MSRDIVVVIIASLIMVAVSIIPCFILGSFFNNVSVTVFLAFTWMPFAVWKFIDKIIPFSLQKYGD